MINRVLRHRSHVFAMEHLQTLFQLLLQRTSLWQAALILTALLLSLMASRYWQRLFNQRLLNSEGLARVLLRSADRVIWPLVLLLALKIGEISFVSIGLESRAISFLIPLVAAFAAVRLTVYLLRKIISGGPLLKASENFIAVMIWLVLGLHLAGLLGDVLAMLDSVAVSAGNVRLSILSGFKLFALVVVALTIAGLISKAVEHRLYETDLINASARVGLVKFVKFALVTVAILVALSSVGIDMSTFAVFGGALGVGLGFGLQRIAANFISGFIVIFDRSIKPGDVVTIGEQFGWVQELKSRYIVLRNRDGVDTLIPNENLITNEVINWSYSDTHVRIKIRVDIDYNDDPEKAMELVTECAKASDRILPDPPPRTSLIDFADSGMTLELRCWIADPEQGQENIRSAVRVAIWKAFREHGISIPFPQRDLHLKSLPDEISTEDLAMSLRQSATLKDKDA